MRFLSLLHFCFLIVLISCLPNNLEFNRLQIVEGGGFTGMYFGYIIHSDGKVYSCEGKEHCDTSNLLKILTPKEVKKLNDILAQYKILELDYQSPQNLNRKIVLDLGTTIRIYIWNPFGKDSIEEKLSELYEKIESFVK